MPRAIAISLISLCCVSFGSAEEKHARTMGIAPKTPVEAISAFRLAPGLKIELVASEPLVQDPVAFDWGTDGRLWVVEMGDYPSGDEKKPGGRIKVLEDRDGDGQYERATLFLDGIPSPTGIKVWRDGVLITAAPEVFFAADTTGDGKADKREVLFRGFVPGNQQHRVNGLRWGLDNWLHLANGDSDGEIVSVKTGKKLNIRHHDLRIRPDTGEMELTSGHAQFGRNRDSWGNWFGCNNSNPMWHYVLRDDMLARNPHLAAPFAKRAISKTPGPAIIFPISKTLERFNEPHRYNRLTSTCSAMIYRDGMLGKQFVGNSFVCEPVHNLVHREIVRRSGVTFTSERAANEAKSEVIASTDSWFRPVMIRTAPDSTLWIADMYRFVIEHPKWIPPHWLKKIDLRAGADRGRIWRVTSSKQDARPIPRLNKLSTPELVSVLQHPNGTRRDMAQQLLFWNNDPAAVMPLRSLLHESEHTLARVHAICTLAGMNQLSASDIVEALTDTHPGVRRHAVRLARGHLTSADVQASLLKIAADRDPFVQLELAYLWGDWKDPRAAKRLGESLSRNHQNHFLVAAGMSSLRTDNVATVLDSLLETSNNQPASELLRTLLPNCVALGLKRFPVALSQTLLDGPPDRLATWQYATLADLLDQTSVEDKSLSDLLASPQQKKLADIFDIAVEITNDPEASQTSKFDMVRFVRHAYLKEPGEATNLLAASLGVENSPRLQQVALAEIGRINHKSVPTQLIKALAAASPELSASIVDVLLYRNEWAKELLATLSAKRLPSSLLTAAARQRLQNHTDESVSQVANRLFATSSDPRRGKQIANYLAGISDDADIKAGMQIFTKQCATCHRLNNVGNTVGPDLATLKDRSSEALVTAIVDPNRAVEAKYVSYVVELDDGRTLSGMITNQSGTNMQLVGTDGVEHMLLRKQITRIKNTGKSQMPEGLSEHLSQEEMSTLVRYLQSVK